MPRRLFTILSALSLLLCMATAGLRVRSHWWRDDLIYGRVNVWSTMGRCRFTTFALPERAQWRAERITFRMET